MRNSRVAAVLLAGLASLATASPLRGAVAVAQSFPGGAQRTSLAGRLTNGGSALEGATVYLEARTGVSDTPAMQPVSIDQEHLRFVPGSIAVTPGTRVLFRNSDPVMHNIFSPGPEPFDLGTHARDQTVHHDFRGVGIHVMLCNIHPEMVAYVNVVPSPWFAVAGDGGEFRLPEVPAGEYVLHVWVPRRRARHSIPVRIGPSAPTFLDLVVSGGNLRVR